LSYYDEFEDYVENDSFKYYGFLLNSQPHGKGIRMNKSTGAIYTGIFNESKFIWGMVLELNPINVLCRYIGDYDKNFE